MSDKMTPENLTWADLTPEEARYLIALKSVKFWYKCLSQAEIDTYQAMTRQDQGQLVLSIFRKSGFDIDTYLENRVNGSIGSKTKPPERVRTKSGHAYSKNGYVYVFTFNETPGLYKIGKATNIDNRLSQHNTSSPYDVVLVHVLPSDDPAELENQLHDYFADKRRNREWFALDADDLARINAVDYPSPIRLAFTPAAPTAKAT